MTTSEEWHGVWGSYPVPDRFRALLANAIPKSRRDAIKATGEFYSWLHQQECKAAAAAMGRMTRQQKRNARLLQLQTAPSGHLGATPQ